MCSEIGKKIKSLSKKDIVWMTEHHCKHRMPYIQHPRCFFAEQKNDIKVGYLDIETGGFNANFDYMLTWCIKTGGKNEYKYDVIEQSDILKFDFDKKILKSLINAIQEYDIIITYYGTKFDIPFIRTRAMSLRVPFPGFGSVQYQDVYYMVKSKMKLHRNSLDSACAILDIQGKNHIKGNFWMRAVVGDKKSLAYVLDHNKKDCAILEKLHRRIDEYVKPGSKSI